MTPIMTTFSGIVLNPFDPRPDQIKIEDIAHHLALINRFVGATRYPVSVAYHSFFGSDLIDERLALAFLLHDGSEAYLGDINKWIKETPEFAKYKEIETWVQGSIYRRFGVELSETDLKELDSIDRLMVRWEGFRATQIYQTKQYEDQRYSQYLPITPEEVRRMKDWKPVSWEEAEELFLDKFEILYQAG